MLHVWLKIVFLISYHILIGSISIFYLNIYIYIYIYIYVLKFVGAVRCSTEVVNQYGKQILCCLCHFPCRLDN